MRGVHMFDPILRVLHVFSDFPGPPFYGGNLPEYNVLRNLSNNHIDLHIAYGIDFGDSVHHDLEELDLLGIKARSAKGFRVSVPLTNAQRLKGLISGKPPGPAYTERSIGLYIRQYVKEIIREYPIDIIHVWGHSLAGSLSVVKFAPKILVAGDCMSTLHETYARSKGFPRSVYHRIAARYLRTYEKFHYPKYNAVVFYSERDREATGLPDKLLQ